jgi:hypothetical protein
MTFPGQGMELMRRREGKGGLYKAETLAHDFVRLRVESHRVDP